METEKLLEKRKKSLQQKQLDNDKVKVIEEKLNEHEKIINHNLRGSYIRSKEKQIEEREIPSKYFCNLESQNFKTIKYLN